MENKGLWPCPQIGLARAHTAIGSAGPVPQCQCALSRIINSAVRRRASASTERVAGSRKTNMVLMPTERMGPPPGASPRVKSVD
jgi:hypothetical protein